MVDDESRLELTIELTRDTDEEDRRELATSAHIGGCGGLKGASVAAYFVHYGNLKCRGK